MSDQEELVQSERRPDTSRDDRREDGLAVFKQLQNEASATRGHTTGGAPEPTRTVLDGTCGMGVDVDAREQQDRDELEMRRASPHNVRFIPRRS